MIVKYKKLFLVVLAISLALPLVLWAKPTLRNATSSPANTGTDRGICARVDVFDSRIDQRITEREAKLEEKRDQITTRLQEKRQTRSQKLEQKRDKWDANREDFYDKLEAKAQDDAQKQALLVFKQAVEAAVIARRTAIDAANQAFKTGVDSAIASRKAAVDAAMSTYQEAVQAALQKAQDDCTSGIAPATVRTQLRANLETARQKYVSDRQAIDKLANAIKPLTEARRTAVKKAIADFKAALEVAKTDLKADWGQLSTDGDS